MASVVTTEQIFDFLDKCAYIGFGRHESYCDAAQTHFRRNMVVLRHGKEMFFSWACFDHTSHLRRTNVVCHLCRELAACSVLRAAPPIPHNEVYVCDGCMRLVRGESENWVMVKHLEEVE